MQDAGALGNGIFVGLDPMSCSWPRGRFSTFDLHQLFVFPFYAGDASGERRESARDEINGNEKREKMREKNGLILILFN